MFENKLTHNGIHYSRYIASWKRSGGKLYRGGLFERWLRDEQKLTNEEIAGILLLTDNGKLELEVSAKDFIARHREEQQEEEKYSNVGGYFNECKAPHMHYIKDYYKKQFRKES